MAELADARDLKSRGTNIPYRFDPGHRHQRNGLKPSVLSLFLFLKKGIINVEFRAVTKELLKLI